jgi:hypothetical protein
LYYFGARYYDANASLWHGVDKMSDKFPQFTPYNYCFNNPVILYDPDGNSQKAFKTIAKMALRAYQRMKKYDKISIYNFKKALKESGFEEVVDFAGDFYTLFDPTSTWVDRGKATIDIVTGLETNNKGNKAAQEAIEKTKELVEDVTKINKTVEKVEKVE